MKALTPTYVAAALIVAVAGLPALANTNSTTSDGMQRATPAQSQNANVTTGQNFQDKHDNALDANTTDTQKVAKKKVKKAKHVARAEPKEQTPPVLPKDTAPQK